MLKARFSSRALEFANSPLAMECRILFQGGFGLSFSKDDSSSIIALSGVIVLLQFVILHFHSQGFPSHLSCFPLMLIVEEWNISPS